MDKIIHIIHIRFPENNLPFISLSQLFFVPLQCRRTSLYLMEQSNHKVQSSHFKVLGDAKRQSRAQSFGRTELATRYFPNIKPMSAWLKLKALLLENPDLAPLTQLKRRTFSPAEVNKIYQALGQP